MTPELRDIKDRSPNRDLIECLERGLELARSGELRSALMVYGWDNDSTSHGWAMDPRSARRMMLAELALAQADFAAKILVDDGGNVFSYMAGHE